MREAVHVRFVFTPPADHAAGLLTLPWSVPLAQWRDDRLVEIRQRGISRHVVRFVYDDGTLYALKELSDWLARREYRVLPALADLNVPGVEAVGIAVDLDEAQPRQEDRDAILVTKFLTYAATYRAVFSHPRGIQPVDGLLDALVELLVRLYLSGFFWGDCSLSNTLFRHDAGTLEAYLVDAETSEQHPTLSDGQRKYDIELATERVAGELLDLQAGERLPDDIAGFRAYLEQKEGRPVSEIVATNRWLEEVYDPVIAAIPEDLRGRLPPAEIFHEVLEHRWYMSEAAGRDVGTTAATRDYLEQVLPDAPLVCPSSDQISTLSGRSSAASGDAAITGVPAAGLPKITRTVSPSVSPTWRASAAWSITANSLIPFAAIMLVSFEVVSATVSGLSLVTTSVSVAVMFSVIVDLLGQGHSRSATLGRWWPRWAPRWCARILAAGIRHLTAAGNSA
jgi:hypothetical protein